MPTPRALCCRMAVCGILDYRTEQYLNTKNKVLGGLYILLQIAVITYIICWVFIMKKGYQDTDVATCSVATKVKGVSVTNSTESGAMVWGPEDYVIPPQSNDVLFVITSFHETPNQKLGYCAESPSVKDGRCTSNKDCEEGTMVVAGHGMKTGRCLKNENSSDTCEIYGWCPVESQTKQNDLILENAENFTIYIKNFIQFPKFDFSKWNVLETSNKSYLKNCQYDEEHHPYCPIFRLGDIIKQAGYDFQHIARKGGSVAIMIKWDCDIDRRFCDPRYQFSSLEGSVSVESISTGLNYRLVRYFKNAAGETYRTHYKVFGVKFHIMVLGKAGRFNIVPMILNIGAGVGLLGASGIICNVVLIFIKKRKCCSQNYEEINTEENDANETQHVETNHTSD